MSDFGVRIGKVLAAFGLCMALFCVPAGAVVYERNFKKEVEEDKREVNALEKEIISLQRELNTLQYELKEKQYSLQEKRHDLIDAYLINNGWGTSQYLTIGTWLNDISHLDPTTNDGNGIGIARWGSNRGSHLKAYAAEKGKDWRDFQLQLDFLQYELETIAPIEVKKLREAVTLDEAMYAFYDFMRFHDDYPVKLIK